MKLQRLAGHAIIGLALAAGVIPLAAQAPGANNKAASVSQVAGSEGSLATVLSLSFGAATETKQYYVDVSGATGALKVDTKDCCIPNDKWGVELIDINGALPPVGSAIPKPKAACGTGSTTAYSGKAVLGSTTVPFNGRAVLIVHYCRGIDSFGAGMDVRVQSSGSISVSARGASGP